MRVIIFFFLIATGISKLLANGHSVSINKTDVWCFGACTGSASVNVTGGTGPFSYSWSNGETTGSISALCAGTYSVTVTDNSDLSTATANVVITQPTQLTTDLPVFDTVCPGVCRTYSADISGGVGPYDYYWVHSGAPLITETVCPSTAQTYQFVVTDQNGCTITSSINLSVIQSNPYPVATISGSYAACNGPVQLTASGGGPGSTYSWLPSTGLNATTGSQVFATPPNIMTYTVIVTDKRGCQDSEWKTVTPSTVNLSTTTVNATCGLSNGSATATASGTHAPFSYTWNTGATGQTLLNVPSGIYTVTAKNNVNCSTTSQVVINSINNTTVTPVISNPLCTGSSDGSISVNATGAGPFTYSWSTGQTISAISNLPAGTYSVTITDTNGCPSIEVYSLSDPSTLNLSFNTTQSNCGNNGSATVIPGGGNPPYNYSWSTGATAAFISGLAPATYTVMVTDANNCTTSAATVVNSFCGNVITGFLYDDVNLNCVFDSGEDVISNQIIKASDGINNYYGYSAQTGEYMIYVPAGNFSINIENPSPGLTVTCPASNSLTASFSGTGDTLNRPFGFENSQLPDMEISTIPGIARPGFQQIVWVTVKNNGTAPSTGSATLDFDPSIQFLSATNGGSATGASVTWNYSAQPGDQLNYMAFFGITATTPLGDTLYYQSEVTASSDNDQSNNSYESFTIVTGSYDPNTKTVLPSGNILRTDSLLTYTVQFQNTGTDTAFNVVVIDTLSSYVDPGSLKLLGASHDYIFSLSGQKVATWKFPNIMLPDSNKNEPMSHGAFRFSVKVKQVIPAGSLIENFADIYFDFNSPVRTDTARNILISPVYIEETNVTFNVYPIPASDAVTFLNESSEIAEILITDLTGKLVMRLSNLTGKKCIVDVSSLSQGTYLYQLRSDSGDSNGRLLISK